MRQNLNKRILKNTVLNILVLVIICCTIMALSMQSLANSILLDSLQPMVRQSAKSVEANIHLLADRMMTIAGDQRMSGVSSDGADTRPDTKTIRTNRTAVLEEAATIYELYTIALYDLSGNLLQGTKDAPETLDSDFFALLQETDNLTTSSDTVFQGNLGITMGMPVKENGETSMYVVGVYKYDAINDIISSINLGKNGMAYMANHAGIVTGHPDQSLVLEGYTLSQISDGNDDAISRITTDETGSTEFPIDGKKMLVAFSPIRGTQWSLVIQVPKSDYNHLINRAMLVAVLLTLAVLVLSILIVLRLARSISRPVKSVTNRMVSLSDGDLHTETVSVQTEDELGIMAKTLNDTVESVNQYISDIQQVLTQIADGNLGVEPQVDYKGDFILIRDSLASIVQSMNETISGFRSAAVRLAEMAEELSGQSGQLHHASLEQHESAASLVDEVNQAKERLADVTESSSQTRVKTEEITQCIQRANAQMSALSGAMNDISSNAHEITKIAKAIEDISFQTNILALNASVEAARAGSAGSGFAVVANEVQNLAVKSAEAAQSATEMISNTLAIIQTGVGLNADTASSLDAISDVSAQISSISDQLVVAVEGQASALSTMEERIDAISAITDRNLQSSEGTSKASQLLASEAEKLQAQVKNFVLKGGLEK
jgi:Methyl-accepting chemotaxis protein